ncbi:glycosyltransferase family 39 protein [Crateriforma conspicua]|uniref:glycosyltransferase family 39 protein n=1 Tax=Crateriforma TaxID=2714592 RepID=UPI0018CDCBC7|nr:glycosyltransferase family 39 protein [Crateriforma conspicua]
MPAYLAGSQSPDHWRQSVVKRPEWDLADAWIEKEPRWLWLASLGKCWMPVLSLLFSLAMFRCVFHHSGLTAAICSVCVLILNPVHIFASTTSTPDLATAALWCAAWMFLVQFLRWPSGSTVVCLAATVGFGLLFKHVFLIFFPALLLSALVADLRSTFAKNGSGRPCVPKALLLALAWCTILGVVYQFDGVGAELGGCQFESKLFAQTSAWINNRIPLVNSIPSPFPYVYLYGLDLQIAEMERVAPTMLDDRRSSAGLWDVLFTVVAKTPIALCLLYIIALFAQACVVGRKKIVAIPAKMLGGIVALSSWLMLQAAFPQLPGEYRYSLPAIFALSLLSGWSLDATGWLQHRRSWVVGGLILVAAGMVVSNLRSIHSFVNCFVATPHQAVYLFQAPGFDTGQDAKWIADWMKGRKEVFTVDWVATASPEAYGLSRVDANRFSPAKRQWIVSRLRLQRFGKLEQLEPMAIERLGVTHLVLPAELRNTIFQEASTQEWFTGIDLASR